MFESRSQRSGEILRLLLGVVWAGFAGGCGSSVPDEVNLELPDGTRRKADLGDGLPSLAESTWNFCPSPLDAAQPLCFEVRFDHEGTVTCIDGQELCSVFPDCRVCADGRRRSTAQAGIAYAAGTYAAETRDQRGMALAARAALWLGGFEVGSIEAQVQAVRDGQDDATFSGTARLSVNVAVPFVDIPSEYLDQEIDFIAVRAEE